jgi:MinD superfamily P-loop ATPase
VRELVVCSGKGGTGKTSVLASFAALAQNTVVADCDVDAADLHLVLDPSIERREEFYGGREAWIDQNRCAGCAGCYDLCRYSAIVEHTDTDGRLTYSVDPLSCEGCGVCVHFCPERAIRFPEKLSGEWFVSETRHGPFVHARLGIAAENSGKLVTLVRNQARSLAEKRNMDLVLIDGPPGIGCPVIASITGADAVLVVTEPTKTALHDLKRVADLSRYFRIPVSVCINKYDINTDEAEEIVRYCAEKNFEIVGTVPYDPHVTRAQMAGTTVVEYGSSPAADAIRQVWDKTRTSILNPA